MTRRLIAGLILAILISLAGSSLSATDCSPTVHEVSSCVPFLQATSGDPSAACCAGVTALSQNATNPSMRNAICVCLHHALETLTYDANRIPLLAKGCNVGITLPPIDKDTDCSKVFL